MITSSDQVTTWVTACRCLSVSDLTSSSESLAWASIRARYRLAAQEANRVSRIVPITSSTIRIRLPRAHAVTSDSRAAASVMGNVLRIWLFGGRNSSGPGYERSGLVRDAAVAPAGYYSTQNSLPSGSAITVRSGPSSRTVAPSLASLATSSGTGPGARRSKCTRFLAILASGTRTNHMFGPPQPAASTKARSGADSSSTSVPSAAAQNRATRSASAQSQVTVLIYDAIWAGYAVGRPGGAAVLPDWGHGSRAAAAADRGRGAGPAGCGGAGRGGKRPGRADHCGPPSGSRPGRGRDPGGRDGRRHQPRAFPRGARPGRPWRPAGRLVRRRRGTGLPPGARPRRAGARADAGRAAAGRVLRLPRRPGGRADPGA